MSFIVQLFCKCEEVIKNDNFWRNFFARKTDKNQWSTHLKTPSAKKKRVSTIDIFPLLFRFVQRIAFKSPYQKRNIQQKMKNIIIPTDIYISVTLVVRARVKNIFLIFNDFLMGRQKLPKSDF